MAEFVMTRLIIFYLFMPRREKKPVIRGFLDWLQSLLLLSPKMDEFLTGRGDYIRKSVKLD